MRPSDGLDVRVEVARHADAELRALWQLYRDGVVREMYCPPDRERYWSSKPGR
jgi:hypothetical protein